MHIVLISACSGKAIKKTIAVLDSYAQRSGDRTWLTPITEEGLRALKKELSRNARRSTAVACFRNQGRQKMQLLWRVGNQKMFNKQGVSFVHYQQAKMTEPLPEALKIAGQLACLAGLTHDLGKFNKDFQDKLKASDEAYQHYKKSGAAEIKLPKPKADPVRHEWLSFLIVKELLTGQQQWEKCWKKWLSQDKKQLYPFVKPKEQEPGLSNAQEVLLYLIATHHRLFKNEKTINYQAHVHKDYYDRDYLPHPVAKPSDKLWQMILQHLNKIIALDTTLNKPALYWRGVATVSRIALILADHQVSSKKIFSQAAAAYANTVRPSGELNQSVDWHLRHVARAANARVFDMFQLLPPTVSQEIIERIDIPSADPRFAWQDRAAFALKTSIEQEAIPHLVLNIAGTGSGKTRMNVRALVALRPRGLRIATALNLRTLTLQTADAYAEQLKIPKEELACVLGDQLTQDLFNQDKIIKRQESIGEGKAAKKIDVIDSIDEDENAPQDDYETSAENQDFFTYNEAPEWLNHFLEQRKLGKMRQVIGAPVLVSTIDFLINAGEPHRQHNHALATLRLMTSDLILDELDSYDPKALLAVLRLVMMAAFFGRHVVASSATLAKPVAEMLWRSYAKGIEMRSLVFDEPKWFASAIIDNQIEPNTLKQNSTQLEKFTQIYQQHVNDMLDKVSQAGCYRKPYLQPIEEKTKNAWGQAIIDAIHTLHEPHQWRDDQTGKTLSFGLVRIANIQTAVKVAKFLAKELPQAFIACYHSQHFVIQRHFIEKTLDELLSRKQGNAHILRHPEIRQRLDQSAFLSIPFIVVATPVEEIGRDHDFDWAVIEPSSAQSIVQTAGRVNRHRLDNVTHPNVAILQFNRREIDNKEKGKEKAVFKWPGLEIGDVPYDSHDLNELFDWDNLEQIDARMRFDDQRHKFAEYDNQALISATKTLLDKQLSEGNNPHLWMSVKTYQDSPLRDRVEWQEKLELIPDNLENCEYLVSDEQGNYAVKRTIKEQEDCPGNVWLYHDDNHLFSLLTHYRLAKEQGLKVIVSVNHLKDLKEKVVRHPAFGFYRQEK